jgi:hypothetical protein
MRNPLKTARHKRPPRNPPLALFPVAALADGRTRRKDKADLLDHPCPNFLGKLIQQPGNQVSEFLHPRSARHRHGQSAAVQSAGRRPAGQLVTDNIVPPGPNLRVYPDLASGKLSENRFEIGRKRCKLTAVFPFHPGREFTMIAAI